MKLLIKDARIISPADKLDQIADILIDGSKILKIGKNIKAGAPKIIDAANKIAVPGLIDMHVHLREPGREDKETVQSGTLAAAKGGVTSVLAMPNTDPAMDSAGNIKLLKDIIQKTANVNVFICGAITKERKGKELVDIAALKKSGALAISEDGNSVDDDNVMFSAFKAAKKAGVPVICHCEDLSLSAGGVINAGFYSTKLGLRGISRESEYKRVSRDINLAKKSGSHIHIAHVSSKESIELIAEAKKTGVNITAETAPHYFTLDESAVEGFDTNMKMNPPLRRKEDLLALRGALKEGIIDIIASDHAPHTENEKEIEFERAAFGVIGLETLLAVSYTELVKTKILDWPQLLMKLTVNPARVLGLKKGLVKEGEDADIAIVSPETEWVVEKEFFLSKSKNSPFINKKLFGLVEYTICKGSIVYSKG
ncbi:MAG: dihydroorotase [Candidatus Omnitrophota bacterium]|nr:MAG: dihydroorotase [Candidatus Omnitrophota bacterium]